MQKGRKCYGGKSGIIIESDNRFAWEGCLYIHNSRQYVIIWGQMPMIIMPA